MPKSHFDEQALRDREAARNDIIDNAMKSAREQIKRLARASQYAELVHNPDTRDTVLRDIVATARLLAGELETAANRAAGPILNKQD